MKTPIQELIDKWEQEKGSYIPNSPIFQEFINDAKEMLDKEKVLIEEVYWEGGQDVLNHGSTFKSWFDKHKDRKVWDALNEQWGLSKKNDE